MHLTPPQDGLKNDWNGPFGIISVYHHEQAHMLSDERKPQRWSQKQAACALTLPSVHTWTSAARPSHGASSRHPSGEGAQTPQPFTHTTELKTVGPQGRAVCVPSGRRFASHLDCRKGTKSNQTKHPDCLLKFPTHHKKFYLLIIGTWMS